MFEYVLELIKKVGIFMILAQTILHLCVSDTYEKYIKMIVGLITAMMLLLPVLNLIKEGGMEDFETYRTQYESQMFGNEPDFETIKDEAWEDYLNDKPQ